MSVERRSPRCRSPPDRAWRTCDATKDLRRSLVGRFVERVWLARMTKPLSEPQKTLCATAILAECIPLRAKSARGDPTGVGGPCQLRSVGDRVAASQRSAASCQEGRNAMHNEQCSAAILASRWSATGAPGEAHRKHRALAGLARHGHVAAHHARQLAGDDEAETGAAEALSGRGMAWLNSSNILAGCSGVMPMPVSTK